MSQNRGLAQTLLIMPTMPHMDLVQSLDYISKSLTFIQLLVLLQDVYFNSWLALPLK